MNSPTIVFPEDFDDYAWEVEAKGWFNGVVVEADGKRFRITFFDAARLTQEIGDALETEAAFFEENTVVLKSVTRESIERAVEFIAASGGFAQMKPKD